jgi:hypothetical protein
MPSERRRRGDASRRYAVFERMQVRDMDVQGVGWNSSIGG